MSAAVETLSALPRMLAGGASSMQDALTDVDAVVRTPVATSRRVSFLQSRNHVGASTAAAFAAATIAARRHGRVLAADATADGRLGSLLGARPTDAAEETVRHRSGRGISGREIRKPSLLAADAPDQILGALDRGSSGTFQLSVGAPSRTAIPPTTSEWRTSVSAIARFFDFVITDWGVRDLGDIARIGDLGHTVCVVTSADRASIEDAARLVPAIADRDAVTGVVLAIVDVGDERESPRGIDFRSAPGRVIRLPHVPSLRDREPGLLSDGPLSIARRLAYLELVAAIIRASAPAVRSRAGSDDEGAA